MGRVIGHAVAAILGITGLTCSLLSTIWCRSVLFEPTKIVDQDIKLLPKLSYGLWRYRTVEFSEVVASNTGEIELIATETCTNYPDDVNIDAMWKTARAFSIMTPILGFVLVLFVFLGSEDPAKWRIIGITIMVLLTLFQGLTLLQFRSDSACGLIPLAQAVQSNRVWYLLAKSAYPNRCQMDSATTVNIVSIASWFLTGLVMIAVGPPDAKQ